MSEAKGPVYAAGFQNVTKSGYEILYLPDLLNDELQKEGKAPVYWWLPNEVRLARRNGDTGDFKFSFVHFYGKPGAGGLDPGPADPANEIAGGGRGIANRPHGAAAFFSGDAGFSRAMVDGREKTSSGGRGVGFDNGNKL